MDILRSLRPTRALVQAWRHAGQTVALVPTMGNLHDGHVSLLRLARQRADRVMVSIFVNPTQFGPSEDFASYPRTLAADLRRLRAARADAVLVPGVATMYPRAGGATVVSVPGLSTDLCGAFRPGHFDGVTSVVLRLFNIVGPDMAVFGEKDYQQLTVIRRMCADLHLPLQVLGAPTVRDADGLAMSSRNQYLTPAERTVAPRLYETLLACRQRLLANEGDRRAIERAALASLRRAGFRPDYVAIRSAADLTLPQPGTRRLRVLAAARLGRARLIDNVSVRLP
ncbi:MAG: pantoate--beta-alanine ligase [Gammaproteobacteria bacterium]|nr:pantoate--beta-alanine ligase [Gammaproteobacteria bacterium]